MSDTKVLVITGANTGLGLETVKTLLKSTHYKYHIYLAGRDLSKATAAVESIATQSSTHGTVEPLQLDVESDSSIAAAVKTVASKFDHIDCLINNAGATFDMQAHTGAIPARTAWSKTFDVSVTGSHLTTQAFLPLLIKSSTPRLLYLSSGGASLTDAGDPAEAVKHAGPAPGPGLPKSFEPVAYRCAKAAVSMLVASNARAFAADGVKVFGVAPPFMATGLGGVGADTLRSMGAGDVGEGADLVVAVVEGKTEAHVGKIIRLNGKVEEVQPW